MATGQAFCGTVGSAERREFSVIGDVVNVASRLQEVAIQNGNTFEELMETVKHCSLGQITHALYEVGGQYRRNM